MPDTPTFLAERLKSEGEKTASFFTALSNEHWQSTVYSEGTAWTVRSILVHFVTSERAFVKLFADVQAGGPGVSEDFSVDRYNARQQEKNREIAPPELLASFVGVRSKMAAWVATLSEADLQKVGRHPYLGITSLAEMIKMVYRHNQIHFRDMRRVLGPT